ncbi:MAG: hypothetical protein IKJ74_05020 [Clostridia bacterium]|nr:hypothetical protein [Clostridia bacterium]
MEKRKPFWKKWLPEKKSVQLLAATLLVTVGVWFNFPERGLPATFPLLFLFGFFGSVVYPRLWFAPVASFAIAFFYGSMANFPATGGFSLFSLTSGLCAALLAAALRNLKKSRLKFSILFFLALIPGLLAPFFFTGSPASYVKERQVADAYLEENYPGQTFDSVIFYYDREEKAYRATVSYGNEGNTLTSSLIFGERVEDGYRADYAEYVLRRHSSKLIEAFQAKELSVVTEANTLLYARDEAIPGAYGTLSEEVLPKTAYFVTFREEKPQREAFRDAIAQALGALKEKEVVYGQITFYALDAGNVVYKCIATPDLEEDDILAQITYNR